MDFVLEQRKKIVLLNDTKHERVCKLVTEIKYHAKNFPNAPRMRLTPQRTEYKHLSFDAA